jgi:hypothetical protein
MDQSRHHFGYLPELHENVTVAGGLRQQPGNMETLTVRRNERERLNIREGVAEDEATLNVGAG